MPSLPQRSGFLLVFAAAIAILVAGCRSEAVVGDHLDLIAELPLWQRVGGIALFTLASEDMACVAAGLLASEKVLPLSWALAGSFLGIFFGDVLLYALGRIGGMGLLRRAPLRWMLKEDQILQAEMLFEEHGAKLIFSSRLLPGSRLPIYAAAGVLQYSFWRFCLFMAVAGALSALVLVTLSRHLGDIVFQWLRTYETYAIPVFLSVAVTVWISVKVFEILATKRSRLLFVARCRRYLQRLRAS